MRSANRIAWAGVTAVALTLAVTLATLVWLGRPGVAPVRLPEPAPLPRETVDLAVACLAAGELRPPLAELSDGELGELVAIVARLLRAYAHGEFASFLALRANDLAHAARARRDDVEELRGFCLNLGVSADELADDWTGLFEAFWRAYYRDAAPIALVRPEQSLVVLHREGLQTRSLAAWEREFEALCSGPPGTRIDHRLVVPHRRSIERVAADFGGLRWLDVQLGFEAHDAVDGRLIARFVWDGAMREWFLHRASTFFDGELRDDRRYLVL
jgi:hypothetical protein